MNGVIAEVLDFVYRTGAHGPEVIAVIVKFQDSKIGQKHRQENLHLHPKVKNMNGVPIFRMKRDYKSERYASSKKTGFDSWVRQFPLSLAFASTGTNYVLH